MSVQQLPRWGPARRGARISAPSLKPATEAYGKLGQVDLLPADKQVHQLGPVIPGRPRAGHGRLTYELGYLFGLTGATPEATKSVLEYEFVPRIDAQRCPDFLSS